MSKKYRIKDITLAGLGRKKITISEKEMPGAWKEAELAVFG